MNSYNRYNNISNNNYNTSCLDIKQISCEIEKFGYKKQAERLENCCKNKVYFKCNCRIYVLPARCMNKVCPKCSKIRSYKIFKEYFEVLKEYKIGHSIYDNNCLRFLTLTIKNRKSLEEAINFLYKSFRKFKQRVYFKNHIFGGIGVMDYTKDENGLWHVHLHLIINSNYLAREYKGHDPKLVQEWKTCTNETGILYINLVKNHKGGLNYVLKYISKVAKNISSKDLAVFYKSTKNRRFLFTFGTMYKVTKKTKFVCKKCDCCLEYAPYLEGLLKSKNVDDSFTGVLDILTCNPPPLEIQSSLAKYD